MGRYWQSRAGLGWRMDAFRCTTQSHSTYERSPRRLRRLWHSGAGENNERHLVKERFRLSIKRFCFHIGTKMQYSRFFWEAVSCLSSVEFKAWLHQDVGIPELALFWAGVQWLKTSWSPSQPEWSCDIILCTAIYTRKGAIFYSACRFIYLILDLHLCQIS